MNLVKVFQECNLMTKLKDYEVLAVLGVSPAVRLYFKVNILLLSAFSSELLAVTTDLIPAVRPQLPPPTHYSASPGGGEDFVFSHRNWQANRHCRGKNKYF